MDPRNVSSFPVFGLCVFPKLSGSFSFRVDCMSSPVIESPTVDEASSSPRSTVLSTSHEACTSKDRHMTTDVATMNEASVTGGTTGAEAKVTSPKEASDTIDGTNGNTNPTPKDSNKGVSATKESGSPIPVPQAAASLPGYPSQLTPQPMSAGYYQGYGHHMTPEPPSPGGNHPVVTARAYETGSFFQQHGAFNAPQNSPFGGPNTPLSPPRGTNQTMGGPIPPASPLFPRVNNGSAGLEGPPASPNLPYMSSGMYQQSYPIVNHANSGSSGSQDEANGWGDRYVYSRTLALHCLDSFLFRHAAHFSSLFNNTETSKTSTSKTPTNKTPTNKTRRISMRTACP